MGLDIHEWENCEPTFASDESPDTATKAAKKQFRLDDRAVAAAEENNEEADVGLAALDELARQLRAYDPTLPTGLDEQIRELLACRAEKLDRQIAQVHEMARLETMGVDLGRGSDRTVAYTFIVGPALHTCPRCGGSGLVKKLGDYAATSPCDCTRVATPNTTQAPLRQA